MIKLPLKIGLIQQVPALGLMAAFARRAHNATVCVFVARSALRRAERAKPGEYSAVRLGRWYVALLTGQVLVLAKQGKPRYAVVKIGSFLPVDFIMTLGALLIFKLILVGRILFVAGRALSLESKKRFVECSVFLLKAADRRVYYVRRLMARSTEGLLVPADKIESGFLVLECRRVETKRLKFGSKMLLVALGAVLIDKCKMKPLPGFDACLKRFVARKTFVVLNALVTQLMARRALGDSRQICMHAGKRSGRNDLRVERRLRYNQDYE